MAVHTNAVENLVIFAPLVIIVVLQGLSNELTVLASIIFFYSRLAHIVLFTFRIPVLRIITFLSGFGAQMLLIKIILGF